MNQPANAGVLSGLRVLDLTGPTGALATTIFAAFGADVLKVESPGGAPTRRYAPFLGGSPESGPSLWHAYYYAGTRAVTLDLEQPAGVERLRELAQAADLLIEDSLPGDLAARGLGYADLAAVNPRLIYTSVTGFGQTGPHAGWRWSDLIAWSMGGLAHMTGLPDCEPLNCAGQANHFAALYAVIGTLIALIERDRSERGQHVEVSAQEAVAAHNEMALPYSYAGEILHRLGSEYAMVVPCRVMLCRDGYVLPVTVSQGQWAGLVDWLVEEDAAADLADPEWTDTFRRIAEREHVHDVLAAWVAPRDKWSLFRAAQERSLPFAIISSTGDLEHDPHLAARNALPAHDWSGTGRQLRAPGPFARLSRGGWAFRGAPADPSPTAKWLPRDLAPDPTSIPPATGAPNEAAGPLTGLKVADFTWVVAGPSGTRILADFGATVVKVEAIAGGDALRGLGPYLDNERGEERSGFFNVINRNKLSTKIDLKHPEGIALAKRLAAWADVVVANFSAGTMERLGLGYETLKQLNPDLIMVEMPGFGSTGPYRDYVSYALPLQGVSGLTYMTGYPDAPPTGIGFAYSDHIGGLSMACAVLLGLAHRQRTGEGQWIEVAQLEASLALIGPAILDYFANGNVRGPVANRPVDSPHGPSGTFPCAGDDRWVAIDVTTDAEWQALCRAIERPDLAERPEFASPAERDRHGDQLAAEVSAWTRTRDPWEAARILQAAGVPAGPVATAVDLYDRDPHLAAREFYVRPEHPVQGAQPIDRPVVRLSRTPATVRTPAPLLGEHTEFVLRQILGLPQADIDHLLIEGIV